MKVRIGEISDSDVYAEAEVSEGLVELSVGHADSSRRAFYMRLNRMEVEALCNALELLAESLPETLEEEGEP